MNKLPFGLQLDRQMDILNATLDDRMRSVCRMMLFEGHPEGRFAEADLVAEVAATYELEPEDMLEVFEKRAYLWEEGLVDG